MEAVLIETRVVTSQRAVRYIVDKKLLGHLNVPDDKSHKAEENDRCSKSPNFLCVSKEAGSLVNGIRPYKRLYIRGLSLVTLEWCNLQDFDFESRSTAQNFPELLLAFRCGSAFLFSSSMVAWFRIQSFVLLFPKLVSMSRFGDVQEGRTKLAI